jgi:hypothetical protein
MIVLVSDTSVLVDLERGGLLDACFGLPFEFAVPDLLFKRELAGYGGAAMVARGLQVVELISGELSFAQAIRGAHPKLSLPDAYAYSLARGRQWTLLTGDGELRALARAEGAPFHGVLWVLDRLFEQPSRDSATILAGLEAIAAHPRCRLPRIEIQARLTRFRFES